MLQWLMPSRRQLASETPRSSGYQFPFSHAVLRNFEERPPFSMLISEMMAFDPKVTIALAVRNGLLMNAEVEVANGRPEVMDFVSSQWAKIWGREGSKILETKKFGYYGFEVMYRDAPKGSQWESRLIFDRLKDFHPRDVRPLVRDSEIVGLTLRNVKNKKAKDQIGSAIPTPAHGGGKIPIWSPKSLWMTYGLQYGNLFGQSLLEHAYPPWHEKHQRGGAIKLRQLRMLKDAWIGDVLKYPNKKITLPNGQEISGRDLAREIAEMRYTGGTVGLPSTRSGPNNDPDFEYQPPTAVQGATDIFEYCSVLDKEILEALETPQEILEAMTSGSGFSGRSIPFLALLAILQEEFAEYVRQIDEQILRPLVKINFAVEPYYEIQPRSMIEVINELMKASDIASQANPASSSQPSHADPQMIQPSRLFGGTSPIQFASGGYTSSRSFAKVIHSPSRHKGNSFTSPDGGCLIGGVYYHAGRLVPAEAVQFASGEEIARIPKPTPRSPEAVGDTPVLYGGDRRALMRQLSATNGNGSGHK